MNVINKIKSYIKFSFKSPIKTAYKVGSIIVVQWKDGSSIVRWDQLNLRML